MKKCLKQSLFSMRGAFSATVAVFIAMLVSPWISFSGQGWIVIAAFLTSQVTQGAPLRQGLILFAMMMATILLASGLVIGLPSIIFFNIVISSLFIICGYCLFRKRAIVYKPLFLMGFLILLIAVLLPVSSISLIQGRILDVTMGAAIGIMSGQFIMPFRWEKKFRQGLIPILHQLIDYSQLLTAHFLQIESISQEEVEAKKYSIEKLLQAQQGVYPNWVYDIGFNPGLRAGFRFFLVYLERIIELFFSLDYWMSRRVESFYLNELAPLLTSTMKKNEELLAVIMDSFSKEKIKDNTADFTQDMIALETAVRRLVPASLELIEISPDYVVLTAITRDIKDLRELLLQLVMALPTA